MATGMTFEYRKSSYSPDTQHGSCVEVGFRKSSYSPDLPAGSCVEVGLGVDDVVAVRDSKDPGGPHLEFSQRTFTGFLNTIKADHRYPRA
jgi:Domain of unknown function (DUF397)